jgi:hypothetical protein
MRIQTQRLASRHVFPYCNIKNLSCLALGMLGPLPLPSAFRREPPTCPPRALHCHAQSNKKMRARTDSATGSGGRLSASRRASWLCADLLYLPAASHRAIVSCRHNCLSVARTRPCVMTLREG